MAFSPEREDPGNKQFGLAQIPKVVGGINPASCQAATNMYAQIVSKVVQVSSTRAAEMVKLLENIFRCVNIALVNELKQLSLRMDLDIWEVIDSAATKPFGFMPFYPGPGLGGHCIPVDPFYLSWKAREYDFATRFIELAGEINTAMPYHVVEALVAALNAHEKSVKGSKILVLGVAYKKDVDDLRESPSLKLLELLSARGAKLDYNDPYFPALYKMRHYDFSNMKSVELSPQNLATYDCVLIATDHTQYDYTPSSAIRNSWWTPATQPGKLKRLASKNRSLLAKSRGCEPGVAKGFACTRVGSTARPERPGPHKICLGK